MHRFEHLGAGKPEPRAGKQGEPVGRAREDRSAAEHARDADGDDADSVSTRVEQRRQRPREHELCRVGFVQPHAARCEQQHDCARALAARGPHHRLQRGAVSLADASREIALVLCRNQHRHAMHARAGNHQAVVLVRRYTETREMRACADWRQVIRATRIGKRRNARDGGRAAQAHPRNVRLPRQWIIHRYEIMP